MNQTTNTGIIKINPIFKRFLKGLVAVLIPVVFSYLTGFLLKNPTALGIYTALVASILLAIEKSIPNNL